MDQTLIPTVLKAQLLAMNYIFYVGLIWVIPRKENLSLPTRVSTVRQNYLKTRKFIWELDMSTKLKSIENG